MPMTELMKIDDVQRLLVSPGDWLLVSVPRNTSAKTAQDIRKRLLDLLPEGVEVFIKTADVQITVVPGDGEDD